MTTYQATLEGYVIRDGDTKIAITDSPELPNTNPDYLAYKAHVDGGGYVEPADVGPLKAAARATINAERNAREQGGFPYAGRIIDSDMASCIRIAGAASAAQAALAQQQPFSVDWTCADNSVLSLDAAGVIGMLAALAVHSDAMHQHARILKAQIDAAQDAAAVEAIDIDAGWPE